MGPKEWFAVAIRVLGAILVLYGLAFLMDSLLFRVGYVTYLDVSQLYYVIWGLSYGAVGLYLLRGAPLIVYFAFPEDDEDEDDSDEERTDEQDTETER